MLLCLVVMGNLELDHVCGWERVNGKTSPGVTSVCITKLSWIKCNEISIQFENKQFFQPDALLCAIGAENGNVTIYELVNGCI